MLPRFSIAVRCRTSTPWRAIICAPRARLTLKIAGSSSGLSPTASATENSNVSIGGRPFTHVDDEDEKDHDQHGTRQQVAEAAEPAVEFRFRRPQRQTVRDGAKLRPQAGGHDQAPRRAASHVGAEEDAIRAGRASPRSAATGPGRFSTGKLSPVRTASLTKKSAASRITPSAGTRLPADEQHDVARHDLFHRHIDGVPVAKDAGSCAHARLKGRRGGLRLVLARVSNAHRGEHDHDDDDGIHPLARHAPMPRRRRPAPAAAGSGADSPAPACA